jgi:hypothetical protein
MSTKHSKGTIDFRQFESALLSHPKQIRLSHALYATLPRWPRRLNREYPAFSAIFPGNPIS